MAADDDIIESDDIAPMSAESLFGQTDDEPSADDGTEVIIDPDDPSAIDTDEYLGQLPFGKTWAFDFSTGRFITKGGSNQIAEVEERDAFAQWVMATLHTERLTCFALSDQAGVEFEEIVRSSGGQTYAAALLRQNIEEALAVHDRYAGITSYSATIEGDIVHISMVIDTTEGPVEVEMST